MEKPYRPGTRAVITGGPGVGKTSICDELESKGYTVIPEAARRLTNMIQRGASQAPPPQENPQVFNEHLLPFMQELYHNEHPTDGSDVIMDRHVIDIAAYTGFYEASTPQGFDELRRRFQPDVAFIPEPLPDYNTDTVRKESEEKAKALHQSIQTAYEFYNVDTVTVPYYDAPKQESIERRGSFIENRL